MKRLVGKKVWIVQYDDEDNNSIIGVVEGLDNGFISLRMESETDPTLYVNLTNVKEIEVFRERENDQFRLLRFPDAGPESNSNGPA